MKKIFLLIVMTLLCVGVAACGRVRLLVPASPSAALPKARR